MQYGLMKSSQRWLCCNGNRPDHFMRCNESSGLWLNTIFPSMSVDSPISVEEAIRRVLLNTDALGYQRLPLAPSLLGKTIAEDVVATENFPPFAASIMDGYAVVGPLEPGDYPIQESIHAGATPQMVLSKDKVAYITTGAALPTGATAVVKVEDTARSGDVKELVTIKVGIQEGVNVRQIGSDIALGEVIVKKGKVLGPYELGLLATAGFSQVLCYNSPVIGIMSTGNELVDSFETPVGNQVRDSNRLSLIASCIENGQQYVDLGIVGDSKEELRRRLLEASLHCDIVVSSGGVSMGAADFVKPLLKEIGTVHFAKLNMKPGKPTTFASYKRTDASGRPGQTLFFGLPGNPVSCLVTKALFVDVAVRRLQGLESEACLHPQLTVTLAGSAIKLDHERPEYHRAILVANEDGSGSVSAYSTGNQRSSRLLSMLSANALLFLPQGPGSVEVGETVQALLIRPMTAAPRARSVHPSAALLDYADEEEAPAAANATSAAAIDRSTETLTSLTDLQKAAGYTSFPRAGTSGHSAAPAPAPVQPDPVKAVAPAVHAKGDWRDIKVGLLTISDRASQGVYEDLSGPEMARLLSEMSAAPDFALSFIISQTAVVGDEIDSIREVVTRWCDPASSERVDLLLTSGGTGFGVRDLTPEAIRPVLHREAPGVAQALLNEGLKHTPLAVLSRPVVGTRHDSLVCTLPGSVKAVRENIVCLKALLPRIMELLKEGECSHVQPYAQAPGHA